MKQDIKKQEPLKKTVTDSSVKKPLETEKKNDSFSRQTTSDESDSGY